MRKQALLILGIILLSLCVGCKSNKEVSTIVGVENIAQKNEEKRLFAEMITAYGSWETFVASGSVNVAGLNSSFELRMIRNEAIQISIRPLLGIEVARIIITPEKISLYDKMSKTASVAELSSLQEKLPFDVSFSNIQSVFLGRPFLMGNEEITLDDFDDFNFEVASPKWIMTPKVTANNIAYMFGMEGQQVTQLSGGEVGNTRRLDWQYSDHETITGHIVPTIIKATATGSTKSYSASLYYTSIAFDTKTSIDSSSFRNYSESSMMDLIKSFMK